MCSKINVLFYFSGLRPLRISSLVRPSPFARPSIHPSIHTFVPFVQPSMCTRSLALFVYVCLSVCVCVYLCVRMLVKAEAQSKVDKKRDKLERKVLDSQERAFWDMHRPMPGCVNTTEMDIKKAYRHGASSHGSGSAGASLNNNPIEQINRLISLRKQKLERRTIKMSKAAESYVFSSLSHIRVPDASFDLTV